MTTALARALPLVTRLCLLLGLALTPLATSQDLSAVDLSGQWSVKLSANFPANPFNLTKGSGKGTVYMTQKNGVISGIVVDKLGKCSSFELPLAGAKAGNGFTIQASGPALDLATCQQVAPVQTSFVATLTDGAHAGALGTGNATVLNFPVAFTTTSTLTRVSGRQSPTDPDGPNGPALPLALIDKGQPGTGGVHDLAVIKLTVPSSVKAKAAPTTKVVKVQIQNRSQHTEVIQDAAMLAGVVELDAQVASGVVSAPVLTLRALPASKFPIALKPRAKFTIGFDAAFAGPADPLAPAQSGTISYTARVHHEALAGAMPDDDPADDVAPRSVVAPYTFDTFPDGSIKEKGVGAKKADKTFGDPVLTKLTVGTL